MGMRRIALALALAALGALVAARAGLRRAPAAEAMAQVSWSGAGYNVMDIAPAGDRQTAGNALVAEMDGYYLSRTPTAKNPCTGLLAGRNVVLILADSWETPDPAEGADTPLGRLWAEGARAEEYYAPDWYQGLDGREFALLAGMTPTTVRDRTAMDRVGDGDICLPFALARVLGREGYTCRALSPREDRAASYEALGFAPAEETPEAGPFPAEPFFLYYLWTGQEGESALEALLGALEGAGLAERTVVCLVTGRDEELRGRLYLSGPGLAGTEAAGPCSELDITPTLLNLLGAGYDARFLSGRDMFAPAGDAAAGDIPLVSLYGSAYSDWVTAVGRYDAGANALLRADGRQVPPGEAARYIRQASQMVYDRYVFARRVLENNYFRTVIKSCH